MPLLNVNDINREYLASNEILDDAFNDLCQRFKNRGDHHDIWHLRFHWPRQKEKIKNKIVSGSYRLSPVKMVKAHQQNIQVWSGEDALVLNALRILMSKNINKINFNLKGFNGPAVAGKKMHKIMLGASKNYSFYMGIKVADFYPSINHQVLLVALKALIQDPWILNLLQQYLNHLQDEEGELMLCEQGLFKGSSLATLLANIYLAPVDDFFEGQSKKTENNTDTLYSRWRDSWVFFCQELTYLNSVVTNMNILLEQLKLKIDMTNSLIDPCEKDCSTSLNISSLPTSKSDSNLKLDTRSAANKLNNKRNQIFMTGLDLNNSRIVTHQSSDSEMNEKTKGTLTEIIKQPVKSPLIKKLREQELKEQKDKEQDYVAE